MNCSLARTVDIIGDQWMLLIIRDAFYGVQAFSEFQERLNLSKTVLSDRLQTLVDAEILERVPTKPGVQRFRYRLTQRGRDLFPVVVALVQWGDRWIFGHEGPPIEIIDKEKKAPIQSIGVIARDGRFLQPKEVTFRPGTGATKQTLAEFER